MSPVHQTTAMKIEIDGLRKEYGRLVAVDDVRFELPPGAILALVGPNGAGKTTLLKMIAALIAPTAGTVRIGSIDGVENPKALHQVIGFLPDFFGLYDDLTVTEYLEYFARAYGLARATRDERVRAVIESVGLSAKANESLAHLSRGMRQRVGIARSLIHDPPLLLLDEPASGLDPEARGDMQALLVDLAKRGKTLIVSSHILTELEEYSTHVAMLSQGHLKAFGSIQGIRASASAQRTFRARVLNNAADAGALLHAQAGISNLLIEGDQRLSFSFDGSETQLADIVRRLVDGGIALTSFHEEEAKMQDAYMSVMKGTSL
ncbi:MAG: ABC transporter ATP-binding protein [Bdellovibrionaceae bacterium]|nr:ABC transporter ATP-binding protein [Pseudobdellovibrionaceae bacterium]